MNLKEAFRYQNKLQNLMDEAEAILSRDRNVTKVENTALRHKVNPDAEDETTVEKPDTEYAEQITEIAVFLMFLLNERERLSYAIRAAKQAITSVSQYNEHHGEAYPGTAKTKQDLLSQDFRNA